MVIMAIDHGDKRIGLAVSDRTESIALGLPTVETDELEGEVTEIRDIARQRGVNKIIMGLPKQMDGSEGQRARKARGFVKKLRRVMPDISFEFVDERMTSARAQRILKSEGADRASRRRNTDRMAAQFILRRYIGGKA